MKPYSKAVILSLKNYENILKFNFKNICKNVPYRVNHSSDFIVDLSRLSSVEYVKCNDGEVMEDHWQTLRVITYKEDRNLTNPRTSKYT